MAIVMLYAQYADDGWSDFVAIDMPDVPKVGDIINIPNLPEDAPTVWSMHETAFYRVVQIVRYCKRNGKSGIEQLYTSAYVRPAPAWPREIP